MEKDVSGMSLIEVALMIMDEHEGGISINELMSQVLELKKIGQDEYNQKLSRLYLDITTSSDFVYLGEGIWDLKSRNSLELFERDGSEFNKGYDDEDEDYEDDDSYDEDDEDEDEESDDNNEEDDSYDDEESDDNYDDDDSYDDEEDSYDDDNYEDDEYDDPYEKMYDDK
ncbi:MAG: DNA-directed RNA polymerase subunit delta [Acholeplasmatales bacterium]|nr:DNA-directed RNA polymerase subunit delta [Acholeplasmatales bacterium]